MFWKLTSLTFIIATIVIAVIKNSRLERIILVNIIRCTLKICCFCHRPLFNDEKKWILFRSELHPTPNPLSLHHTMLHQRGPFQHTDSTLYRGEGRGGDMVKLSNRPNVSWLFTSIVPILSPSHPSRNRQWAFVSIYQWLENTMQLRVSFHSNVSSATKYTKHFSWNSRQFKDVCVFERNVTPGWETLRFPPL